jgi:hypothetical protein
MDVTVRGMRPKADIVSNLEEALDLSPEDVDAVAIEWLYTVFTANYFSGQLFFSPIGGEYPEDDPRRRNFNTPILFFTPKLPAIAELLREFAEGPEECLRRLLEITGERRTRIKSTARTILLKTIAYRDRRISLVLYERARRRFEINNVVLLAPPNMRVSRRLTHPRIYP